VQKRIVLPPGLFLLCALFTVREHRNALHVFFKPLEIAEDTAETRTTENQTVRVRQFSAVACGNVRSTSTCFSDESHLMSCSSRLSNAVEIFIASSSATLLKKASVLKSLAK
jgi:hypothetical protein